MKLLFEWDAAKARSNFKKHGITFEEATTIFGDPRAITIESQRPSGESVSSLLAYQAQVP